MALLVLPLLLLLGFLIALRLRPRGAVEWTAWTLLLALTAAPLAALALAWIGRWYVGPTLLVAVAAPASLALLPGTLGRLKELGSTPPDRWEVAALLLAAATAGFTALHHHGGELLLSLASWLGRGEAECFYMQSFALVRGLDPAGDPAGIREAWSIINTPGNVAFTAPLLPLLKGATFRVVDALVRALLLLLIFACVRRWTDRPAAALLAGLFAVGNAWILRVEVLDRNVIAATLTAALLLALWTWPDKPLLHGLLLGLAAGTGLRCLPLVFAAPVLGLHLGRRAPLRDHGLLLAGFTAAFAVELPHLLHHGLHSLGETEPIGALAWAAISDPSRSPGLAFPNAVQYLLEGLDLFGLLACGLILVGAVASVRGPGRRLMGLMLPVLGVALVLAIQRDWLQFDKGRILLCATAPLAILLGRATAELLDPARRRAAAIGLLVAVAALWGLGLAAGRVDVPAEAGSRGRHPIYQGETAPRLELQRASLRRAGLLPDWSRLGPKLDVGRKRAEEAALRQALFGLHASESIRRVPVQAGWWAVEPGRPAEAEPGGDLVDLEIDLEALVTDPDAAVRLLPDEPGRRPWVNLGEESPLDLYYRSVRVSWQPQELPVAVLPLRPEVGALGELYVDLNALIGFGLDEAGFERVGGVDLLRRPDGWELARRTGMTALPEPDRSPTLVLRVPRRMPVVVRDWLVDQSSGTPHRVDSWWIEVEGDEARCRFLFGEPESYL